MPRYLVEAFAARSRSGEAEVRKQAQRVDGLVAGVRHLRTTLLPADEVALHMFEAPSIDALERAGRRAGLQYERIVEALEQSEESDAPVTTPPRGLARHHTEEGT